LRGCPQCWAAFDDVGPVDDTPTGNPLRRALVRILSPGSWPALSAGHFLAALKARHQLYGLLSLMGEEAATLALAETPPSLHPVAAVMFWAEGLKIQLGKTLVPALYAERLARLLTLCAEIEGASDQREEAEKSLALATSYSDRCGDDGGLTRVRLLQARARLARRFGQEDPAAVYLEAIELATRSQGLAIHQLELAVELAGLEGWNPADGLRRVVQALDQARGLRCSSNDVVRAHALYQCARLLATAMSESLGGLQVPDVVSKIAAELDGAEALFDAVADPPTRALRRQCLDELRLLEAPVQALAVH
jgi:hypothetical protein